MVAFGRVGIGTAVALGYAALHARTRLAHPPHLRRGREPRARSSPPRSACSRAAAPEGFRILVVDDDSPDGTGRDRRPARRRARATSRCCTARARGARPGLPRGLRPRAGRGRGLRLRDGRATSRTTRPTSRACWPPCATGRRPRARLALRRRAAASATGGSCAGSSAAAAASTRGSSSACRCATSPAASSASAPRCSRRSTCRRVRSHGYAFQVELTYRALRARLSRRRGADHLPRPPARRVEDVLADRGRGDLARSGAAPAPPLLSADGAARLKRAARAADAQRDGPRRSSSSKACATRAGRSRAGTRARAACSRPWFARRARDRAALLAVVWVVAASRTPDPRPIAAAGPERAGRPRRRRPHPLPQLARARAARVGLRRGLHRRQLAAAGGRALHGLLARASTSKAGPLAISSSSCATLFSLATQAYVLGRIGARRCRRSSDLAGQLILALLPHAIPELIGALPAAGGLD